MIFSQTFVQSLKVFSRWRFFHRACVAKTLKRRQIAEASQGRIHRFARRNVETPRNPCIHPQANMVDFS